MCSLAIERLQTETSGAINFTILSNATISVWNVRSKPPDEQVSRKRWHEVSWDRMSPQTCFESADTVFRQPFRRRHAACAKGQTQPESSPDSQLGRPTASPQHRARVFRCPAGKIIRSDGLHTRQADLYQGAGGHRKAHQKECRNLWRMKPPCNIKRHCASGREPTQKVPPMEHADVPSSCSNINQLQRLAKRREPCKRECAMERRFRSARSRPSAKMKAWTRHEIAYVHRNFESTVVALLLTANML